MQKAFRPVNASELLSKLQELQQEIKEAQANSDEAPVEKPAKKEEETCKRDAYARARLLSR